MIMIANWQTETARVIDGDVAATRKSYEWDEGFEVFEVPDPYSIVETLEGNRLALDPGSGLRLLLDRLADLDESGDAEALSEALYLWRLVGCPRATP